MSVIGATTLQPSIAIKVVEDADEYAAEVASLLRKNTTKITMPWGPMTGQRVAEASLSIIGVSVRHLRPPSLQMSFFNSSMSLYDREEVRRKWMKEIT
jgi:hypothetical protein